MVPQSKNLSIREGVSLRGIRTIVLAIAVLATSTLSMIGPVSSAAAAPTATSWAVGDPTFQPPVARPTTVGVNYHPLWLDLDAAKRASILDQYAAAGVEWVRIDIGWANIQPNQPAAGSVGAARYSASALAFVDERLAEIAQRGMKAQALFYLPPFWSSGRGSASNPAKNGIPRNYQDYADALAFAAQRWQAVAPVWEIWNEPDITDFWYTKDVVTFAQLLKLSYETAKNASPTTTFVSAAPTYLGLDSKNGAASGQWIRKMYDNGARVGKLDPSTGRWTGSYDQIGIHPYQAPADLPPEAPAGVWSMRGIPNLVALMTSYGEANVRLNASEFGWTAHPNTGSEQPWERGVTEDQQADYTVRGFGILGGFPQVAAAFVFTDRDFSNNNNNWGDRFGLLRADLTKKKGYYALKCVASLICGPSQGPVPAAPNGLAGAFAAQRIELSWNGVAGATGYRVYRSSPGEANHQVAQAGTTSWNDAGVAAGRTYAYTVTALNANGESPAAAAVSVSTPLEALGAPTGVTVTAVGSTTARVSWTAPQGTATSTVTRTPTAPGMPLQLTPVTDTTLDDTGLTPGATYSYTVTATNAGGSSPPSASVSVTLPTAPTGPATYIAPGASQWRIQDSGSDLGTAWRALAYNDTAWRQGATEIGYGDGGEATVAAKNRVTYYFRKSFDAGTSISGLTRLSMRAIVDDGAVVYLNGVEVWRFNMPTGTIGYTTRASTFMAGADESRWRTVTLPLSALRPGDNVIAIEVHNDQPSSSDMSMNLELTSG